MRQTGSVGEVLCPVLVGRQAEIQALELALDGALAGRGGCAVITGEAGIGESRLMRELSRMAGGPDAPPGPAPAELGRALAAHGITNVGPPMEQAEAERLARQLAGAAALG
jgi:hypothetical protein